MQKDAFKPQGREVGVVSVGNPLMGQAPAARRMVQAPAAPSFAPAQQPHAAPLPMDPATRGAAISSDKTVPRGAQEVRLAGPAAPPLTAAAFERGGNSFQPSGPAPVLPSQEQVMPQQAPSLAQAPRPFLRRPQNDGGTVFRVTMRGIGPDGAEYASVYDAAFPPGTQPMDLDFAQIT